MHNKLLIVDKAIALLGRRNIGKDTEKRAGYTLIA